MSTPSLKSLDFQGQPIYYIATPEGNHILIRPLCELLGLHADKQIERIKEDEVLADEHAVQRVHLPGDDRHRTWSSLPEEFIYGWLFGIKMTNTMSDATKQNLVGYKRACYHALYQHFHGKIIQTQKLQKEEATIELELRAIEQRLLEKQEQDPDYQRKQELLAKKKLVRSEQAKQQKEERQIAFDFAQAEFSDN